MARESSQVNLSGAMCRGLGAASEADGPLWLPYGATKRHIVLQLGIIRRMPDACRKHGIRRGGTA
jgi:hypothetical protein